MGFLGEFFSGKDKSFEETRTKTSSGYNLPEWLKTAIDQTNQGGLAELTKLRGTTADERFVDFTPEELAAFQRVSQGTGQYDDIVGSALGTLQQAQAKAFEGVNPDDIQKFMNPYQQQVIDATQRELIRDADVQNTKIGDAAARAGAFGGSRHGLVEAENQRNLLQSLADVQNSGLRDSYDRAVTAARQSTTDAINAGGAIGNLAGQAQGIYNTDVQTLMQAGQQQRGLEQAKTDFTYTNPLETYYQEQAFQTGAAPLYGTVGTQNSTTAGSTPGEGWGSQLIGTVTSLAGLGFSEGGHVSLSDILSNLPMVGATSPYSDTSGLYPTASQKIQDVLSPLSKLQDLEEIDVDSSRLGIAPIRQEGPVPSSAALPDKELAERIAMPRSIPTPSARDGMELGKKEKTLWERLTDDEINTPLLKAGLAMMASDKPFFQAISEGGSAFLGERERIDNTEAARAQAVQELAQKQAELEADQAYKAERLKDYDEAQRLKKMQVETYLKDVESRATKLPAEQKQQVDVLKARHKSLSELLSNSVTRNPELEAQIKTIEAQLDSLVGLSSGQPTPQDATIPSGVKRLTVGDIYGKQN